MIVAMPKTERADDAAALASLSAQHERELTWQSPKHCNTRV